MTMTVVDRALVAGATSTAYATAGAWKGWPV